MFPTQNKQDSSSILGPHPTVPQKKRTDRRMTGQLGPQKQDKRTVSQDSETTGSLISKSAKRPRTADDKSPNNSNTWSPQNIQSAQKTYLANKTAVKDKEAQNCNGLLPLEQSEIEVEEKSPILAEDGIGSKVDLLLTKLNQVRELVLEPEKAIDLEKYKKLKVERNLVDEKLRGMKLEVLELEKVKTGLSKELEAVEEIAKKFEAIIRE